MASTLLYSPVDTPSSEVDSTPGALLSDHIKNLLTDPKREEEISLLRDNFQEFIPLEGMDEDLPYDERLAVSSDHCNTEKRITRSPRLANRNL